MFDGILILALAVGITAVLSWMFGYSDYYERVSDAKDRYSEKYGIDLDISQDDYDKLSDEQKQLYYDADAEFANDEEVLFAYGMLFNLSLVILSLSLLTAFIALELVVPIFLKYGRTLGKKIFGLAVVRTNGVKMTGQAHFIRSIIGKYTMETMVPVYITVMILFGNLGVVGTGVLLMFLVLELFVVFYTKTRSAIHDLVSDTVVVDMANQMIFENEDELIAYKAKLHQEMVEKQDY